VVLDCTDARSLAEFYRKLLGFTYRQGHEPKEGEPERDWLVIHDPAGQRRVAFQQVDHLRQSTWPDDAVPQQLHLDMKVRTVADLDTQHGRVLSLGGRILYDRSDDPEEPLRVYADPDGHPFCIFVSAPR
jgi:catechol 2,3-dioxygenase-like lactoylglutathione lyase family enzyme